MYGATPVPFTGTGAVGPQNANGYVWIHGITAAETGGASSVTIVLHDSGASSGNVVGAFALPAGTGLSPGALPKIKVKTGAYATVTGSGTLSAVLYVS